MRQCILLVPALVIVGLAGARQVRAQEPTFDLGFAGGFCGTTVEGPPGSSFSETIDCTLTTSNNPGADGAQGWSISLGVAGALRIVGISTRDTVAATAPDVEEDCIPDPPGPGLRVNGFQKSELTEGEGNEGAVSAIVLSFTCPITLPPDGTSVIARIDVSGDFPAEAEQTASGSVSYVGGRQGSGQPVPNDVTWTGVTVSPGIGECAIDLFARPGPQECCNAPLSIFYQRAIVADAQVEEAFAEAIADCVDIAGNNVYEVSGESTHVFVGINSSAANGLPSGAQGWSLSVAVEGDVTPTDVTTRGTIAATSPDVDEDCVPDSPPGQRVNGFQKSEIVDPTMPGTEGGPPQGAGAVSAVVLSFTCPITLQVTGSATVLDLTLAPSGEPTAEKPIVGTLFVKDGLRGSGQPVPNAVTVGGKTLFFCHPPGLDVTFSVSAVPRYLPGNANGDSRVDLADPIWIVNELFRDGPATACPESGDVNGDQMVDLSDVSFLIDYLFRGGMPPSSVGECIEAAEDSSCVTQVSC